MAVSVSPNSVASSGAVAVSARFNRSMMRRLAPERSATGMNTSLPISQGGVGKMAVTREPAVGLSGDSVRGAGRVIRAAAAAVYGCVP